MRQSLPIAATVALFTRHGFPARASDVAGLSSPRLRTAVDSGALIRLRRGIYMPAAPWEAADWRMRHEWALRAALLAYPDAWASHSSALLLNGVEVLQSGSDEHLPTVHISRPGLFRREPGLVVHNVDLDPSSIVTVNGMRSCSLVRSSIEVAARRPLGPAVAVIDAAMRQWVSVRDDEVTRHAARRPSTRAQLFSEWDAQIAPFSRHRWVTTVRKAIRWADPCAESYLESVSRVAMRESGLPQPDIGAPVVGDNGSTYWLDFWWEDFALIGEADGLSKYETKDKVLNEKLRQEALSMRNRFVRWGMAQVEPDPRPMLDRVSAALYIGQSSKRMDWRDLWAEGA